MNFNLLDPLSKHMHLIIIGLFAYVLLCHVKENDYITMVILTAATCLSICYLKKKKLVEGNACTKKKLVEGYGGCGVKNPEEGFENSKEPETKAADKPVGSDIVRELPAMMGPYDGLCLKTGNKEYWMKSPDNTALIPNDALFSYLSSQGPLKPVFTDDSALHGPPIDGHPDSAKKMFMFANNRTSPNCCPGTYSTSTGCVCTTDNQRDYIASRGGAIGGAIKKVNLQEI